MGSSQEDLTTKILYNREHVSMYPLITRDPVSGEELIVTRLECPTSGVAIEGRFSLGWIGRLTREQLDFVELLVKYRGNVQRLAQEMSVAYNTARSRLDEIVDALVQYPPTDRWNEENLTSLPDVRNANGTIPTMSSDFALGGIVENNGRIDRRIILGRLAAKEISVEEAMQLLKG